MNFFEYTNILSGWNGGFWPDLALVFCTLVEVFSKKLFLGIWVGFSLVVSGCGFAVTRGRGNFRFARFFDLAFDQAQNDNYYLRSFEWCGVCLAETTHPNPLFSREGA